MLKLGDKVIMNDKYCVADIHKGVVYTVQSNPQGVCGEEVVWLNGYDGCYATDGLTVVNGAIISAAGTIIDGVSLIDFSR